MALVALASLLLNDWWAKPRMPGLVTGKVSDLAGLALAPLALCGAVGVVVYALHAFGGAMCPASSQRRLRWCVAVVGLAFVACKLSPTIAEATAASLRVLGWRAHVVADPSDLLMLPGLYVAWRVGRAELALVPRGYVHFALRTKDRGRLSDCADAGASPSRLAELAKALEIEDREAINVALRALAAAPRVS